MLKRGDQLHPLGICQRVFTFISRLVSPLMPSASPGPTGGPVMNGVHSMDEPQRSESPFKSNREENVNHKGRKVSKDDNSGSEIEIHFKETEESLEYWTPIDKLGFSVHYDHNSPQFTKDDGISSTSTAIDPAKDKTKEKKSKIAEPPLPEIKAKKKKSAIDPAKDKAKEKKSKIAEPPLPEIKAKKKKSVVAEPRAAEVEAKKNKTKFIEPPQNTELPLVQVNGTSPPPGAKRDDSTGQGKGLQEIPQFAQERDAQKVVSRGKGKSIASEQISVPIEAKETTLRNTQNILSANINEKSDEFLRSRKEAMRRNLGLF